MTYEQYQRLIENALKARNNCKKDSWGYKFWNNVFHTIIETTKRSNPNS